MGFLGIPYYSKVNFTNLTVIGVGGGGLVYKGEQEDFGSVSKGCVITILGKLPSKNSSAQKRNLTKNIERKLKFL